MFSLSPMYSFTDFGLHERYDKKREKIIFDAYGVFTQELSVEGDYVSIFYSELYDVFSDARDDDISMLCKALEDYGLCKINLIDLLRDDNSDDDDDDEGLLDKLGEWISIFKVKRFPSLWGVKTNNPARLIEINEWVETYGAGKYAFYLGYAPKLEKSYSITILYEGKAGELCEKLDNGQKESETKIHHFDLHDFLASSFAHNHLVYG